jgi:hypothetical protein
VKEKTKNQKQVLLEKFIDLRQLRTNRDLSSSEVEALKQEVDDEMASIDQ